MAAEFEVRGVMLTGPQIAQRLGITPAGWRSMVRKGLAPRPDDPGDVSVSVQRRTPRWHDATIAAWLPTRPGSGRPRGT